MKKRNSPAGRWTVNAASIAFGVDNHTLAKRLVAENIKPDAENTYSTKEICLAIYSDIRGERLRKVRNEADLLDIELQKGRSEVITVQNAFLSFSGILYQIKRSIVLLPNLAVALVGKSQPEIHGALQAETDRILTEISTTPREELLAEITKHNELNEKSSDKT